MKFLFLVILSMNAFAGNPILTSASEGSEGSSGCNVKFHLGLEDRKDFLQFHDSLIKLVKEDDSKGIAKIINYPLTFSNKKLKIANEESFIKNYGVIFNKEIKSIILNQDRNKFFCKSSGLMYGRGEVWVNNYNKSEELKIVTVNQKQ